MSQSSYPTQDYPTPTTLHDSTDPHSPSDSPTGLSAQDDSARPPSRLLPPGAGYATSSPPDEVSRPALPPPPPPLPAPPASHPPFLRTDSTTSSASPALPLQFSLLPPSLASPPQPALVSPPLTPPNPRTSLPPTSLPYQRMEGPYPQPSSKGKQREEDGPRERDSMVGVGRDSILRASMELLGPQPAPHLVLQPEICVECMMRDRDMVGVDVTGEGAWARESDQDWEEAVRWDEEGSEESVRRSREVGSRESARSYARRGKRIGKGQPLTVESLKLWTSMVSALFAFQRRQELNDDDDRTLLPRHTAGEPFRPFSRRRSTSSNSNDKRAHRPPQNEIAPASASPPLPSSPPATVPVPRISFPTASSSRTSTSNGTARLPGRGRRVARGTMGEGTRTRRSSRLRRSRTLGTLLRRRPAYGATHSETSRG